MPSGSHHDAALRIDEIRENFKFLWIEISGQIAAAAELLNHPSARIFNKICSRDDYIDNLKTTVENACFSRIHSAEPLDKEEINTIRTIHIICVNLERIADFCVNIARQLEYLSDPNFIHRFDYHSMIQEIEHNISNILPAFDNRKLSGALNICRSEYRLDQLYKNEFDRIMVELNEGRSAQDLVTALFIFRYLERIGDSLLNIGEALLFLIIGEKIKIHQFEALQKTLTASGYNGELSEIDFKSIWGTRSGCRISLIAQKDASNEKSQGVFKEGNLDKIRREKDNLIKWDKIYPGLTPRIFGYHENNENASLLVEFLSGCTIQEVILSASTDIVQNALFLLEQGLSDIWEQTLTPGAIPVSYTQQLLSRLEDSQRLHPDLLRSEKKFGSLEIPSTIGLIRKCAAIESEIQAPFSVFCHGDFNANNLVYDHSTQRIHFIDVYRSHQGDYIEDAAIFLVSNFRLPVFEASLRERLNEVIAQFLDLVIRFAAEHDDATFQVRLALALCRSFYTSIRFEHNDGFAKEMVLRSHYLMEKITNHASMTWDTFSIPEDVLFYE
jgi:phosphate uptake regulator